MRDQFARWYPLATDERKRLIIEGLVVVDANVLLQFYRLTAGVRADIISLLHRLGDRLWIPHQVGLEFHRNRLAVIREQEQSEQKLRDTIAAARKTLHQATASLRDHPAIDRAALQQAIDDGFGQIDAYLNTAADEPYLSVTAAIREDDVLDAITELFRGKTGSPYAPAQLEAVEAEAQRRIDAREPPGYCDAKKEGNRRYGDYILWRQLLDEAAQRKLPVLLITNDQKDDWYRHYNGLTVGPRMELASEMLEQTGDILHLQTLSMFIDTAPAWLRSPVREATVAEVVRLEEFKDTSSRADAASDLAERGWDQPQPNPGHDQRHLHTEGADLEQARQAARQAELHLRVGELRAELNSAMKRARASGSDPDDPRSYEQALRARLEVSQQLLEEATQQKPAP